MAAFCASGNARSSKARRSTRAHKGAGCGLIADGCVGIVGPKIGEWFLLRFNFLLGLAYAASGALLLSLLRAVGARVGRPRLHFTKRQFSPLASGLRLKVREGHSDESNALRRREHGTDQVTRKADRSSRQFKRGAGYKKSPSRKPELAAVPDTGRTLRANPQNVPMR